MKPFRRLLPFAAAALCAVVIALAVVWFRQAHGPEHVRHWWQAWRHGASSSNVAVARPVPFAADALAPELRARVSEARHDPAAAFQAFEDWRRRYALATGLEREAMLAEGVAAAEARRTLLREIIALDPELALRLAVPRLERARLPDAVVDRLEQPVSGRGDFRVIATENDPPIRREALIDGRAYEAFVYGRRAGLASVSGVGLHGVEIDGRLALFDSPVRILEAGEMPAPGRKVDELCVISGQPSGPGQKTNDEPVIAADTGDHVYYLCSAGHIALLEDKLFAQENGTATVSAETAAAGSLVTKRVLVIRLRFAGEEDDAEPQSQTSVQSMFADADAFMRENSYGTLAITPIVTPVYTLPHTAEWYQTSDTSGYALNMLEAGRAIAASPTGDDNDGLAAFNYLDYDFEIVRYNGGPGTFSGQGYVGVRGCWIKSSSAGVLAHELGHNLGLWHANYWEPDDPDAPLGSGHNREYGDDFDTMGRSNAGAWHFNAAEKARLGWLPAGVIDSVFVSGTHRIYAHDRGGPLDPALRYGLRVPRGDGRDYWFEFRQHPGWAANPWLMNGLGARWDAWDASNGGTQLLDTTSGSSGGKDDSAIVIGRTYSDPIGDVHVTPLHKNGTVPESLDVDVEIGPFPGNRAPTVQLSATTSQVAVGAGVKLTAFTSDPDGDGLAYAWDFGDHTIGANASAVTHAWSAAGDHRVRVTVSDRKGGTASASLLVRAGTATGSRVSGKVLDLAGKPVPEVRVATALGSVDVNYHEALTDADGTYTLTNVTNGTWGLTATKAGWTFAPLAFADPIIVAGETSGVDFVGRAGGWRVTGFVRRADGQPVAGAIVGDGTRSEPTDENGAFTFVGVPAGAYTLQATAAGMQFAPETIAVAYGDTVASTITETTFTLSGEVTGAGTTPVTISDGWHVATSTVVGSGATARNTFALAGVPAGTWFLEASAPGARFSPVTFTNPIQVTGDRTGLVFALDGAAATTGVSIHGLVTVGPVGLAGARVQAGATTTTTDSRGSYALNEIPAGSQVVSVSADGCTFVPASREVAVGTTDVNGIDFAADHRNRPPTFTQAARASGALDRPFVKLSARATDDGGDALVRYTWSLVGTAPGAVGFSANGAHGAGDTVAQFAAAGTYRIRVTATDAEGASASSELTVTIAAVTVQLTIVPAALTAVIGEPVTLAVQCRNQFNALVAAPAGVSWSVNGGGTITHAGVFSPTSPGRGFVATARMNGLSATCVIDVGYARGPGYGVTQEIWSGLAGDSVHQLTSATGFPNQPNYASDLEGALEIGVGENGESNYGERLRGFFVPPASGDYVFRIASSSASELWLSTGSDPAGRVLLASNPVVVGFRQWGVLASQSSAPVRLVRNSPVYLEVLHKAGAAGGDHVSVGVELPGGVFEGPVPGHRLLPWGARAFPPPRIVSPARATPAVIGEGLSSNLDVMAASDGGEGALVYTWSNQRAAPGPVVFLPNGTNAAKTTVARFAQPGKYTLLVTVSDVAHQSVTSTVTVSIIETLASWQRAHFSAAELDDPSKEATRWGTDADPDGDGVANLLEYAFGFDPLVPDPGAAPRPGFVTVEGVRYLAITFHRNTAASDVVFTPQASSDLKSWEVGLVPVGDPDAADVTYRDFAPADSFDRRFLRVEVTGP